MLKISWQEEPYRKIAYIIIAHSIHCTHIKYILYVLYDVHIVYSVPFLCIFDYLSTSNHINTKPNNNKSENSTDAKKRNTHDHHDRSPIIIYCILWYLSRRWWWWRRGKDMPICHFRINKLHSFLLLMWTVVYKHLKKQWTCASCT